MSTPIHKAVFTAITALSLTSPLAISAPQVAWSQGGFDEPESVLTHPTKPLLFVSNINGKPTELNGKGYISVLSDDGKILRHVWAMGMDAPKGMAIDSKYLYVADMQQLHIVDNENGQIVKTLKADSSVMLNDVAIDDKGIVYISDMLGGGIYRYSDNQLSQWISGDQLPHPNGLIFKDGKLTVATWGKGIREDFTTESLGGLVTVNRKTGTLTPYIDGEQFGNLDGIASIGNSLLISDWMNGNIFEYKNNKTKLLFNAGQYSADISAKGDLLYVPMMFSQRIDTYKMKL